MSDGTIRVAAEKKVIAQVVLKPVSWMATIDFVKHLISDNNILVSFLGEQGSGKTTFAHLLQTELATQIKPCMITASPLIDHATFLQQLTGLLDNDHGSGLSIANCIAQSNEQKSPILLIIDDAHYLSTAFIEEILKAVQQQGNGGYFHVCLLSNFSLVSTFNKLAQDTYTDMIHSIELGSLNESETQTYIVQNLLPLPDAEKIITDERVKQFYQLTAGHIEAINRQMVDFFNYKSAKSLQKAKPWRHVGVAAGVFLAATGGVYLWLAQDFQPAPAQLVSIESHALPTVNHTPEERIEPVFNSQVPAYDVAVVRQALHVTSLRRVELADIDEEDNNTPDESMVVMDKVVVAPKVLPIKAKQSVPAIKKVTKAAVIKPIIEQSRYTIQILASRNRDELKRFAQRHHFNGKTHVRRTQRQGTVWYVLTLGEYTQRQLAKQAVKHLPQDIAQFKPWVRLVSDLKTVG